MTIKRAYRFINKKIGNSKGLFKIKTKKQINYMNGLPKPVNDIQRSYNQYKCQKLQDTSRFALFNMGSFFSLIPIILYFRLKTNKHIDDVNKGKAVYITSGASREIIPASLFNEYEVIVDVEINSSYKLNSCDLSIIFSIMRQYPFSFYFILKNIIKIAFYRNVIDRYNPEAIISTSEYSYSSSVLTYYCERNSVKHINVMHGEKLLNIRQSFFRFHNCYVWDKHYVKLFTKLRAEKDQFRVEVPNSLKINCEKFSIENKVDYKYYLGAPTDQELIEVSKIIVNIEKLGFTIKVRPHPLDIDMKVIEKYIPSKNIENSRDICLSSSICNSRNVIGAFSTVLLQAYLCGKQVFLDDVIYKKEVDKLEELEYILISKKVNYLSSLFD